MVRSDPDLTGIVFESTFANAAVAIEKQSGGKGEIELDIRPIDREMIRVMVQDSSGGLPESDLDRAFEPFYSTKPDRFGLRLSIAANVGEVRGLGMAVSLDHPGQ